MVEKKLLSWIVIDYCLGFLFIYLLVSRYAVSTQHARIGLATKFAKLDYGQMCIYVGMLFAFFWI